MIPLSDQKKILSIITLIVLIWIIAQCLGGFEVIDTKWEILKGAVMNWIINVFDILSRGTTEWLLHGGRHKLAIQVFGIWLVYQFILHLWLIMHIYKWLIKKFNKFME